MQRAALLMLALCLLATPARAGLDIAWSACPSDGGTSDIVFACANASAVHTLYAQLQSPVAIPEFIAMDAVLTIQVDAGALTPFHDFGHPVTNPLGCNPGWTVRYEHPSTGCAGASNLLCGASPCGGIAVDPSAFIPGTGGPNRGRFLFAPARAVSNPVAMNADVNYFAFALSFHTALAGLCSGCTTPMQIVWNAATLSTADDVVLIVTGPGLGTDTATTFGGGSIPGGATPTRRTTWSALKSLYR